MVSPFMSFATGALDSIGKQIDKYDAAGAAKDLRDEARDQRQEDLEFQRQTQYELAKRADTRATNVANINRAGTRRGKFNSFGGGGGDKKPVNFEYRRDTDADQEAQNLFTATQANPDGFKRALNDANTGDMLRARVFEALSIVRRGQGVFSQANSFGKDYRGELPQNVPFSYLKHVLKMTKSPELDSLARQFSRDPASMRDTPPPPNVNSSSLEAGKLVDNTTKYKNVKAASLAFANVNLGVTDADAQRAMFKSLKDAGTDRITNQIYINAAANPNLMSAISASTGPNSRQKTAALAYLQDPNNGFLSTDPEKPNTIDVAGFRQFVSIFGRRMAGKHLDGAEPQPKTFSTINKGQVAQRISTIKEVGEVAKAALKVADAIIIGINESKAGGSLIQSAQIMRMTVPQFIKDGGEVLSSILRDRGYGSSRMKGEGGVTIDSVSKKALLMMEVAKGNLLSANVNYQKNKKSENNIKSLAAAKLEMLELTFAYQITGILQGGTGGRTISDTDITRALKMFRTRAGTVESRLQNVKFIKGLITSSITKAEIYGILDRNDLNADMYTSVINAASLFDSGLTQDNFDDQANSVANQANVESPDNIRTNNPTAIVAAAAKISEVKNGSIFNAGAYADGIEKVLSSSDNSTISPGKILNRKFVVNADVMDLLTNAVNKFGEPNNKAHIEERERINKAAIQRMPMVFNLITGKIETRVLTTIINEKREVVVSLSDGPELTNNTSSTSKATLPRLGSVRPAASNAKTSVSSSVPRSTVGRPLSERRATPRVRPPGEVAASQQQLAIDAERAETRREAARERARRSGSLLFGGGNR